MRAGSTFMQGMVVCICGIGPGEWYLPEFICPQCTGPTFNVKWCKLQLSLYGVCKGHVEWHHVCPAHCPTCSVAIPETGKWCAWCPCYSTSFTRCFTTFLVGIITRSIAHSIYMGYDGITLDSDLQSVAVLYQQV